MKMIQNNFIGILILFCCFSHKGSSQTTAILDLNFELKLISLGYDSGSPDGIVLTANINTITALDVSFSNINSLSGIEDFTLLDSMTCSGNNLTQLDVSNNTNLYFLDCAFNSLSELDVTQDTLLTLLEASNNLLDSIDLTKNTELMFLGLRYNNLKSLDLSNNSKLESILCHNNQLNCLNVKNGNNVNVFWFDATFNNNLTCIEVDNVSYSNNNWTSKDAGASYSNYCSNTCSTVGISEYYNESLFVYPNPTSDLIYIDSESSIDQVNLFDLTGRSIISRVDRTKVIDVSNLKSGLYILRIQSKGETYTYRVVVQ